MMNRPTLIVAGLLAAAFLFVSRPQANAAQLQEPETHDEAGPLEVAMDALEDNLRILRKSLKDETRAEESLTAILAMQKATDAAKLTTPHMAEALEGEARKEFMLAYRLKFLALGHDLLTLEEHVLKNEPDKAKELYKRIHDHEESGHEHFSED